MIVAGFVSLRKRIGDVTGVNGGRSPLFRKTITGERPPYSCKALQRKEQQAVLRRVLQDKTLRNDMVDLALIENRRAEPTRPLRDVLANQRRRKSTEGSEIIVQNSCALTESIHPATTGSAFGSNGFFRTAREKI
jgi:hypothetical protein